MPYVPTQAKMSSPIQWKTSSWCASQTCVEVGITDDFVLVRDTKDAAGPSLQYSRSEWRDFVAGVKSGEFDVE